VTAPIGADEVRIRYLLRAHGLGYTPGALMAEPPITPTRIIPAGAPLPDWLPTPGETPPWHTPPPPPPAAAAPPPKIPEPAAERPIQVYVTVQPTPWFEPEPVPEPTRWDRAMTLVRRIGKPWQLCLALAAAVFPIPGPGHGYSAATTWFWTVAQTRVEHGAPWAYGLAAGALTATAYLVSQRPGPLRLFLLAVAFVGGFGALNWHDPITLITGVHR